MTVMDRTLLTDRDFRKFYLNSAIERMIVSVEPGGRFSYAEVNRAAAVYFGLPRDSMTGRTPAGLFERALAEHIESALAACARSGKSMTHSMLPQFQGGLRMKVFILTPISDAEGAVRFIDVMARPEAGDGAHLQRERDDALTLMTSVFDASGLGILVTDRHGRTVRVNDAFTADFGWTRADLLGENFSLMLPPEDRDISMRLYRGFMETGRHGSRELRMRKKSGGEAYVLVTSAMIELSQGRRFMVTTVRDMTERRQMMLNFKRAKEEADAASRAKSAFLANMSHELRTPLNAIIGFTELMQAHTFGPVGTPKYEEYMSDIHFSARHLLEIINSVLDMSKIEAGKVELSESAVELGELFDSVLRIMADRAQAAQVVLDFQSGPAVPRLRADRQLLRQVLINLVSNAIKFSPSGRAVALRAGAGTDGGVVITVRDEGIGIAADKLAVVMQPFGQANDPRHSSGQGTGLGLPLSRAMTELHGGLLALESAEGEGTTVRLSFPPERTLPPG